jgi:hypothetical protein
MQEINVFRDIGGFQRQTRFAMLSRAPPSFAMGLSEPGGKTIRS